MGEGDFVEAGLKPAQEKLDRKYHIQSRGYSIERLIKRVAKLFEISPKELLSGGKHAKTVKARSARASARNNYTRLRRILVRLQGTSAGTYRDMCWWM